MRRSSKQSKQRVIKLSEDATIDVSFYNSEVDVLRLKPFGDIIAEPGEVLRFQVVGVKLRADWITNNSL